MPVVTGIIAGVGVLSSIIGGQKAAKAAKEQARREAALEKIVTDEKVRQLGMEEEALAGNTIAQVAGAGVKVDQGSPLAVLAAQAKEYDYVTLATRRAGASRAASALAGGNMVAQSAKYSSYSEAASGIASIIKGFI